ncbi:MAG: glycosyl hydrolase [Bacteroidota bacterium]
MRYFLFLLLLLPAALNSQVTGYSLNFNDNSMNGWVTDHSRTFQLSADSGALKIGYTRTASSDMWDNFNYTPPQNIDISSTKTITVRVRSTVGTSLSFKSVFASGEQYLTKNILGDNEWHTIIFVYSNPASYVVNKLYLYLDGGSTVLRSGTVYFDDVRFGDSATVAADNSSLTRAIGSVNKLLLNSAEGTQEGQFPAGSKAVLQNAVTSAQSFLTSTDQKKIDQAVWDLFDAASTFERNVKTLSVKLVDSLATKETRYLYLNMNAIAPTSMLFGMHDVTGYGVGWTGDDDRSDIKSVVGEYPSFYAEDITSIDQNNNVDRFTYRVTSAYNRGGVISFVWHMLDPLGRGFYQSDVNNEKIVPMILPGGAYHLAYKARLKKIALFLKGLRGAKGESIPIIFRPFHEHTGNWFWWGAGNATTQEFNSVWQMTVQYLRDSMNVHNLLFALSPSLDHVGSGNQYYNIYPGDNYVDVFGTDFYFGNTVSEGDITTFTQRLNTFVGKALGKSKMAALTEVGQEALPTTNWFTNALLRPIKDDTINTNIAYAAVWRNASTTHHYAPYPGHSSVPDFIKFYNDPYTIFETDVPKLYLAPAPDTTAPMIVTRIDTMMIFFKQQFDLSLKTNERAYVKYGPADLPFESLPFVFTGGGGMNHTAQLTLAHGQKAKIYVRTKDLFGNTAKQSAVIDYTVDTLEAPILWTDMRYPIPSWASGATPIGTDAAAVTKSQSVRTVYFRKTFSITTLPTAFAVLIKSYGGCVVYLNGAEVGRINMPNTNPVLFDTDPTTAAAFNQYLVVDSVGRKNLKVGENLIAVEIHAPTGSPVLSFNSLAINQVNAAFYPLNSPWTYFDKGYRPADMKVKQILGVVDDASVPLTMSLHGNYPNPFNPSTTVRYSLSQRSDVRLEVYDILGRRISVLVDELQNTGIYDVRFDGRNLSSGIYFVRMQAGVYSTVHKMTLLK